MPADIQGLGHVYVITSMSYMEFNYTSMLYVQWQFK